MHAKNTQSNLEPTLTLGHIQAVFVHNTLKLYASVVRRLGAEDDTDALALLARMAETASQRLPLFVQSGWPLLMVLTPGDLEVQERAVTVLETIKYLTRKREQGSVAHTR